MSVGCLRTLGWFLKLILENSWSDRDKMFLLVEKTMDLEAINRILRHVLQKTLRVSTGHFEAYINDVCGHQYAVANCLRIAE